MSYQKVIVAGYLAKDPEVKTFDGGGQVTKLSICINEKWDGGEHAEWFNIDCFGKTAENCAKFLAKGSTVIVEGTNRTTEKDGKRYTSLRAFNVRFLGGGEKKPAPTSNDEPSLDTIPF
jgi:single-strand DNA-binding protein